MILKQLPRMLAISALIGMSVPAYGDDPLPPKELEGYVIDNAQAIVDAGEDRAALQKQFDKKLQQLREEKQQLKATVDQLVTRLDQLTQALEQSTASTKAYANTKASQAEQAAKAYAKAHANTKVIAYATGNGPNDYREAGQITSRVLRFTKAKTHTKIRISYTDNLTTVLLTVGKYRKSCRWEIRVDGRSCPNQALVYDYYANYKDYIHQSSTVVGYCSGVAAGSHTIGIWVGNTPGYSDSDCHTGYNDSTWVIEVQEVN
ncbi:MAG TPA: hypothetical protein ENG03_09430 [Thioploca sp.]|nr:hypothetical protein [Thioploca sp.]